MFLQQTPVLVAKPAGGINLAMMAMNLDGTLRWMMEHRAPSVLGRGLAPWALVPLIRPLWGCRLLAPEGCRDWSAGAVPSREERSECFSSGGQGTRLRARGVVVTGGKASQILEDPLPTTRRAAGDGEVCSWVLSQMTWHEEKA